MCFAIFGTVKIPFLAKFENGRHFWGGENFLKIAKIAIFGKNSKIQNGRHFWGGENFLKIANITFLRTLWVENFYEIALSRTVKEIEANLCFAIFGKNSKIQNGRIFGEGKIF